MRSFKKSNDIGNLTRDLPACSIVPQSAKYNYGFQVKKDKMGRACSLNGERRNTYMQLTGKREGKRQLGRLRQSLANNIKMDLGELR
jgi:hypothetical protein